MELADFEKQCNIQMEYKPEEKSVELPPIYFPCNQQKDAFVASYDNKFMDQTMVSPRPSLDVPVLPSVTVNPKPVGSKRSSSIDDYRTEVLRKRRATRLGSTLSDPLNEKDEPDTPSACLARYVERASVPGLAYLFTSRTRLARMAWCAMLLFTLGMLTMHLFYLISTYLSWPKHTKVTLGFDALQFPAVTFCNANPIRASKLHLASPDLQDLANKIEPDALTQEMIKNGLRDFHDFAKNEIQNEDKAKIEETAQEGVNQLNNFFARNQPPSPKRNNNNNNNNNKEMAKNDVHVDSKNYVDEETTQMLEVRKSSSVVTHGIERNELSNTEGSTKSKLLIEKTSTSASIEFGESTESSMASSTEKTTKKSDQDRLIGLARDVFRGRRSVFKKKKGPSVPIETLADRASDEIDKLNQEAAEKDNREINTSQSPMTTVTDAIDLNTIEGNDVTDPPPGGHREVCSQAPLSLNSGTNVTGFINNTVSNISFPNATFCSMETITEEITTSTPSSMDSRITTSGESTEEQEIMTFINGLDILGPPNPRSEVEMDVFSDKANRFKERSTMAEIQHQFRYLFVNETRGTRVKLGHRIKDMLVDCSFQGGRCYPKDFKLITSPTFGNCYTMDYANLRVLQSGPANGLTLIIFLESMEYLKGLTSSSGGHIVIHESNTFAFPDKDGLALAAGMEISIALRRTHISRLGQPHGDCNNGDEFWSIYQHLYTRRNFCQHSLIATHCGCYDTEDEEVHRIMMLNPDVNVIHKPCHTHKDLKCMLETERKYLMRELDCDCQNPCHDVTYTKTISSRQWPTDDFSEILIQTLCESRSEEECKKYKQIDRRQFSQNFLKVSIFYEDLNYENITEQASYELTQFCSDIGGALGLWMGLSVVALLEVLHFFTSLGRLLAAFVSKRFTWLMDREKTGPLK